MKALKLYSPESFPVAILAGGLATRMHPITLTIPKALIDVAGRLFIHRQLHYLKSQGIRRVVLCLGFLGEQVEAAVGDGSEFGLEIGYCYDGKTLRGTGGALRQAAPLLGDTFFVLYGDSFLPCDFMVIQHAFTACAKPALMTVLRNEDRWDKSNVLFVNDRLLEYNKKAPRPEMSHIDYGLGVLSGRVLNKYPAEAVFDLATVYHNLSVAGELAGYEVRERFYEIGSADGLADAVRYFQGVER